MEYHIIDQKKGNYFVLGEHSLMCENTCTPPHKDFFSSSNHNNTPKYSAVLQILSI